jgi:hypothetical protein
MDKESRRESQSGVAVVDAAAAWARGLDPPCFIAARMAASAIAQTPATTAQVVSRLVRMRHFYASRAQATSVSHGHPRQAAVQQVTRGLGQRQRREGPVVGPSRRISV